MKKLFSLLLVVVMMACLATAAFAADEDGVGTGSYSTDVTGNYVAGTTASGTVFSVDITWTNMSFTYHAEQAPVWDVDSHSYSEATPAYWEGEGTITVTNHSNAKISAVPSYAQATGYETHDMIFSTTELKIASAETTNSAQTGTITVTPDGYLPEMDGAKTIGSITVTIAQDTDVTAAEAQELLTKIRALMDVPEVKADDADLTSLDDAKARLETALAMFNTNGSDSNQSSLNSNYSLALGRYDQIFAKYNP